MVVEAMMCGVVPIVSRLPGITDQLVQEGETGLLVMPRDINGFVEAIRKIHDDIDLYQKMSLSARKVAVEKFSLETMVDRYEALFVEPDDRNRKGKSGVPGWYVEAGLQLGRKRMR